MIIFNDKIELTEETAHLLTDIASQNDCSEFDIIELILEDWAIKILLNLEEE